MKILYISVSCFHPYAYPPWIPIFPFLDLYSTLSFIIQPEAKVMIF